MERKSKSGLPAMLKLENGEITKHLDMQLDKNDIVAYQVAKAEASLEAEKERLDKEIEKAQNNANKLAKAIDSVIAKVAESAYKAKVESLRNAFAALGKKHTSKISGFIGTTSDCNGKSSECIQVRIDLDSAISIVPDPIKITAELKRIEKKLDASRKETSELIRSQAETSIQLSKIDSMERRAKAKMIENILSATEGGRSILSVATK